MAITDEQRQLFRDRHGPWTQVELAEEAGVSVVTIRSLENGYANRYTVASLARLAAVLEITPDELRSAGLPDVAARQPIELRAMQRRQRDDAFAEEVRKTMRRLTIS